jgi:DNA invertase Pin-like site-specific DNA recombinase
MAAVLKSSAVAYSYIRFSTPDQIRGDSLRRQTADAEAWCSRNGVRLDKSRTLHDLGKSAYLGSHRKNPDRCALAAFLKMVEDGKVPQGSYLLVESLDRLTREHIRPALTLLLNLIEAGVRIVQLRPVEIIYDEDVEPMTLMMALMELSRGNSESRMKSQRLGAAWEKKRAAARDEGKLLTHCLPPWVEDHNGTLVAIPEKAAAIRRIFALAGQGFGASRIVGQLVAEKVPTIHDIPNRRGQRSTWLRSYISQLLNDRRAVGEFQMKGKRGREKIGPPAIDYFPRIISEGEWQRARAGVNARRVNGFKGRGSYDKGFVNLFTSLLRDARDGGSSYNVTVVCPSKRGVQHRVLRNLSQDGRAPCRSYPHDVFEWGILQMLHEIDPAEVLDQTEKPDVRLVIAAELERVNSQVASVKENIIKGGEVSALADVLRELEARQRELAERDEAARQQAARPLVEAWTETKSLMTTLREAPDPHDARLRLRAALRRIVASIWVLIVPRGRVRLAAVQIYFADGKRCRDYLIFYRPPSANHIGTAYAAENHACSLAGVIKPGELDLRDRRHAEALERQLLGIDLEQLASEVAKPKGRNG